jgi:hypothetical protein
VKVTANITDDQIRSIDPYYLDSQTRCDALGLPRGAYEYPLQQGDVQHARERCAAIYNAMQEQP